MTLRPRALRSRHGAAVRPPPIEDALKLHQTGRLDHARALYLQILAARPQDPYALHLLGVVNLQRGRPARAATLIKRSIALKLDYPEAYGNLGVSLVALGSLDGAVAAYQQAIALKPKVPHWHRDLGGALAALGRFEEAIPCYRQALVIRPSYAQAHADLATALKELGQFAESAACLRQAVTLAPDNADWHGNLGVALTAVGQFEEAVGCFRRALEIQPDDGVAHRNMAMANQRLRRFDEAVISLRRAVAIEPQNAQWNYELAAALIAADQREEAAACLRQTIALQPDHAPAYDRLAFVLKELCQWDEAVACLRQAIALRPDFAEARGHLGMLLLLLGRLREGFEAYRWRWRVANFPNKLPVLPCPLWEGESLAGKCILVHCEQGLGDSLQFIRYVLPLRSLAARVWVQTDPALVSLFQSVPGIAVGTQVSDVPQAPDYHVPLLCLPRLFATDLGSIPADVPYLMPSPAKIDRWTTRLAPLIGKINVGLVWAGNGAQEDADARAMDLRRSVSLQQLAPLGGIEGVQFFSLQKGEASKQSQSAPRDLNLIDLTEDLHDFEDTAAFVTHLDLVISVDTAVVHLAGALGKPVWMLNRYDTCWRWMLNRDDSPWYPHLRQFRQTSPGDWQGVIDRLRDALQRLAQPTGDERPVRNSHASQRPLASC